MGTKLIIQYKNEEQNSTPRQNEFCLENSDGDQNYSYTVEQEAQAFFENEYLLSLAQEIKYVKDEDEIIEILRDEFEYQMDEAYKKGQAETLKIIEGLFNCTTKLVEENEE